MSQSVLHRSLYSTCMMWCPANLLCMDQGHELRIEVKENQELLVTVRPALLSCTPLVSHYSMSSFKQFFKSLLQTVWRCAGEAGAGRGVWHRALSGRAAGVERAEACGARLILALLRELCWMATYRRSRANSGQGLVWSQVFTWHGAVLELTADAEGLEEVTDVVYVHAMLLSCL